MKPERWRLVRRLFDAAVDLERAERRPFLLGHCEDSEIVAEVLDLIAVDGDASQFLERSKLDLPARTAREPVAPVAPAAADGESLTGRAVENFVVGERLGVGGMGEVYAGYDTKLQRHVALKAIRRDQRMDAAARARFLREARVLSNLDHPNICRIYDYLESDDCDLLVLELIQGRSLRAALAEDLPQRARLEIAQSICEALSAAHAEGIVHRDLKPSNVMLTASNEVKILDFGLARVVGDRESDAAAPESVAPERGAAESGLVDNGSVEGFGISGSATRFQTAQGLIAGTPSAMSPEQLHGKDATPASDMYSFGLLLHELFTGEPAYDPELELHDLVVRARRGDTRRVKGIDKHLTALIESLKATRASERATAAQAGDRLNRIRAAPQRRLRWALVAAVGLASALAGLKYTVDLEHERTAAVVARGEAELRRQQAEALIGFMLGDLRAKLEPIGRLEILDDVGDQALDYFAAVPEAELTEDELHSRSQALAQIGEVRTAQGDLASAQEAFAESLTLAQGLASRRPEDVRYLASLGAAHFWVGSVHWWRGEATAALAQFEDYLAVAERLVATEPDTLEWQMELSYALSNLGLVHKATGERYVALEEFRRAFELNQAVVDREPENATWLSDLADARSWVAETLAETGDLEGALAEGRAYQAMMQELAAGHPQDAQLRRMLADSYDNVGMLLLNRGQLPEAAAQFERYESAFAGLVELDPSNNDWRHGLAIAGRRAGEVLLERGRSREAAARLGAAYASFQELLALDPTNNTWSYETGICQVLRSVALVASGAPREAEAVVRSLLSRAAVGVGGELDEERVMALRGRAFLVLGDALSATGRKVEAENAWAAALAAIESVVAADAMMTSRDLKAQTLARLGRPVEAAAIRRGLREAGYRRIFLDPPKQ